MADQNNTEEQTNTEAQKKPRKILFPIVLGIIIIAIGIYVYAKVSYSLVHESTDDAQIDGTIYPVLSRVAGYVDSVDFQDNQHVKRDQLLVKIDDRDLILKVEEAQTALQNAQASVSVANANVANVEASVATAQANVNATQVKVWQTTQDFTRAQNLLKDGTYTQQEYDNAKANYDGANTALEVTQKQLDAAKVNLQSAQDQVGVAQSVVKQRQADLDYAKLQLSYTHIYSPGNGNTSKKNIDIGQYVQAGQTLFSVVDDTDIYVTANFKETQLSDIKLGQDVEVDVDAFSGKPLQGKVQSFSSATGARYSLLPPDNATGNFVKVVQRVPVKIVFNSNQALVSQLRPGMSVSVSIATK
jgi:membrane fusion protein, multidrug efflux system